MCIISGPVKSVSDTQIFVGTNKDRTSQVTVYGNKVDNVSRGNAMILPVPFPSSLRLIDLSNYTDIFKDCALDFHDPTATLSYSRGIDGFSNSKSVLPVFNVGSYSVSVAQNLSDLKRVDASVFIMHKECFDILSQHYRESYWGFLICQLKNGNHKYHPMAYSHAILNNTFFIPTRHYHAETAPHMVGPIMGVNTRGGAGFGFGDIGAIGGGGESHAGGDWNHTIYVHNGLKSGYRGKYEWSKTCHVNKLPLQFPLSKARHFERIDIEGQHENVDIWIPVQPPHKTEKTDRKPVAAVSPRVGHLTVQEQLLIKKLFPHLSRAEYELLYGK